ncbi:MAG: hypothetical protein ABIR19_11830 [Ginsengibacter sp.]
MQSNLLYLSLLIFSTSQVCIGQYNAPLYTSYTTKAARAKMHGRIISNTIINNLSFPLTDSTEENWEDAFGGIEFLVYKTPLTQSKIDFAFKNLSTRSVTFQRSLIEMIYAVYPGVYKSEVGIFIESIEDPRLFAMCAEYLIASNNIETIKHISSLVNGKFSELSILDPVLYMLNLRMAELKNKFQKAPENILEKLFSRSFIPGKTIMYSIQRKNRDFPGLVVIRDPWGNFIKDSSGQLFHIPQLARSMTNLPGYIRNGNTPQGIFLMYGFGVSMSNFIGPSVNVQMGMPFELDVKKFLADSAITDSIWSLQYYDRLVPAELRNYQPIYDSYYAGLAGRNEIIAHGTTIDPAYYNDKTYYPLTPSMGCLCTREIWDGKRIESDQQKLVNALLQGGGANGYCVVIELDDKQAPVSINEILPLL